MKKEESVFFGSGRLCTRCLKPPILFSPRVPECVSRVFPEVGGWLKARYAMQEWSRRWHCNGAALPIETNLPETSTCKVAMSVNYWLKRSVIAPVRIQVQAKHDAADSTGNTARYA